MVRPIILLLLALMIAENAAFNVVFMARRGKGGLKKNLEDSGGGPKAVKSLNKGKGQEITGVTLPADGKLDCLWIDSIEKRITEL